MVGELAEVVGVVAVVGVEGVGQGVALGLEHDAATVVLAEDLNEGGGAGVGREEEHPERRFHGLFDRQLLLVDLVFAHLLLVVHNFGLVDFAHTVVDGLDDVLAEGQAAFAGGCLGGYEEVEVGPVGTVVIDAGKVRKTGGDADDGADEEDVGNLGIVAVVHYILKEGGQEVTDLGGESWQLLFFFALISSASLTSLIRWCGNCAGSDDFLFLV